MLAGQPNILQLPLLYPLTNYRNPVSYAYDSRHAIVYFVSFVIYSYAIYFILFFTFVVVGVVVCLLGFRYFVLRLNQLRSRVMPSFSTVH